MLELSNGNVDAIILGAEIATKYAEQFEDIVLSQVKLEADEAMAVAAPKGSEELIAKVNEVIAKLKADGSLDAMLEEAIQMSNE